jgi:ribosomal protein S18 acetylase RimI-like enzyme
VRSYVFDVAISTYWKIPFEWRSPTPPEDDPLRDGWIWANGSEIPQPVELVAATLADSPGPEDHHAVEKLGPVEAARQTLDLNVGFSYLHERWHVLIVDDEPAGFVLPVIYDGCAREGLDEATIYHMGVVPAHRGSGIGRLLLRHATRLLVDHGVWRIFCDTPESNEPMIHLFIQEGWTRLPPLKRPIANL